ncbi:MAG: crossover junction endodeoxyribonuclease RuvC, partial [Planctomycetes bacterium]|nr:crossover junction endodeoxyribonuclease RuvC [Planctomycetota bacterium]
MRVIGIDPGTLHAGYGVVEELSGGYRCVASGSIDASGPDVATRLVTIFEGLSLAIQRYQPEEAAVETVFAGNNVKTAIVIGEARGVALLAAARAGVAVTGYEPSVIKRAVASNGKATKEQVQRMIQILLGLPQLPPTDHEADALAMAITHLR